MCECTWHQYSRVECGHHVNTGLRFVLILPWSQYIEMLHIKKKPQTAFGWRACIADAASSSSETHLSLSSSVGQFDDFNCKQNWYTLYVHICDACVSYHMWDTARLGLALAVCHDNDDEEFTCESSAPIRVVCELFHASYMQVCCTNSNNSHTHTHTHHTPHSPDTIDTTQSVDASCVDIDTYTYV